MVRTRQFRFLPGWNPRRQRLESRSDAINRTTAWHTRRGNEDDAKGDAAYRAVLDGLLLRFVPRPRQPGLRRARDGQRPSSIIVSLRLRRRHLLRVVLPFRGAEQSPPG